MFQVAPEHQKLWVVAEALFRDGKSLRDIASATGLNLATIRTKHQRHWKHNQTNLNQTNAKDKSLSQRSASARDRLSLEIDRQLDVLCECPPKTIAELQADKSQGRTALVKTLIESAERVYNWTPDTPSQLITVGRIESMQVNLVPPTSTNTSTIVDVPPA